MWNPLPLRLCCLAVMAPALTSEAANRARDKLPGASTTPLVQEPAVGVKRREGLMVSRPLATTTGIRGILKKDSTSVNFAQDLQCKFLEVKETQSKTKISQNILDLNTISTLTELYKQESLIPYNSTLIKRLDKSSKGIMNQPHPANSTSTSSNTLVKGTKNGTVTVNGGTADLPSSSMIPNTTSGAVNQTTCHAESSLKPTVSEPPQVTSTNLVTLPKSSSVGNDSTGIVPMKPMNEPVASTSTSASNGIMSIIKKSSVPPPTAINKFSFQTPPVTNVSAVKVSETLSPRVMVRVNSVATQNEAELADEVNRRQKTLVSKAERLLKRMRRLQCHQTTTHIRQQIAGMVTHQQQHIKGQALEGADLLHSKDVKNLSTAALVSLVQKLQSSSNSSSMRHHGGSSYGQEMPTTSQAPQTKLEQDLCRDLDKVSGHLSCNLHHLERTVDSDATESSSGGESCDDLDFDDEWDGKSARPSIEQRCEWRWVRNRSAVAARWTWLQAQVSDLEYRIRQQNDIYRQIRNNKGAVVLGEPPVSDDSKHNMLCIVSQSKTTKHITHLEEKIANLQGKIQTSPANLSSVMSNIDQQSSQLTQQLGNVFSPQASPLVGASGTISPVSTPKLSNPLNGYMDPNGSTVNPENVPLNTPPTQLRVPPLNFDAPLPIVDPTCQAARCRPLRSYRKRKILRTSGLHQTNRKAARLSNVRCHCYPPVTPCTMCGGRYNNVQHLEPYMMPVSEKVALLDHSYHQVLSFPQDIALSVHFDAMIKTGDWQNRLPPKSLKVASTEKKRPRVKDSVRKYSRHLPKGTSSAVLSSTKIRNKYDLKQGPRGHHAASVNSPTKEILTKSELKMRKKKASMRRGVSLNFDETKFVNSLHKEESLSSSQSLAFKDVRRRRGENAFDINNIVIPYSMSASTRVEKLKYKEIVTPKWREIGADSGDSKEVLEPAKDVPSIPVEEGAGDAALPPKPDPIPDVQPEAKEEEIEDLSDDLYRVRHARCEVSEKKRYLGLVPTGQRRGRANRSDSVCSSAPPPAEIKSPEISEETSLVTPSPISTLELGDLEEGTSSGMKRIPHTDDLIIRRRSESVSSKSGRSRSGSHSEDRRSHSVIMDEEDIVVIPFPSRNFPLNESEYDVVLWEESRMRHACKAEDSRAAAAYSEDKVRQEKGGAAPYQDLDALESTPSSPGKTESISDVIDEDPNDPEWTVVCEKDATSRLTTSKGPGIVLKFSKR